MMGELKNDKSLYLYYFLILSIFLGILVRFYGIGNAWIEGDEPLTMISGIKLNHENNPYDPRLFLYENPPVARWFTGFPTRFIDTDFSPTVSIPLNLNVLSYFVPFKEIYVQTRLVSALFGALSVLLVFLITRNLFGLKAGIWGAVSASMSFDLIFYSRWTLTEAMFVGLALLTLYFYILYLQEKNSMRRLLFMGLTAVFFTLALGTRSFTPLFLIPALLLSQFLINRGKIKENILFTVLLLAGIYVFLSVFYPPEVRALAQKLHGVYSLSGVIKFSLPDVLLVNIYRNSYLYVFSLLLLLYEGFVYLMKSKDRISLKSLTDYLKNPAPSFAIVLLLIVSLAGFTFTKYSLPRYQVLLFIPLFILAGKPLEKAAENKALSILLVFLVAINILFFVKVYPYYSEYQNFYFGKCGDYMISCSSTGWQNHIPELKEAMSYLGGFGNPPVMTNEFNVLTFYKGEAIPLITYDSRCNPNDVKQLVSTHKYIVYWGARGAQADLRNDTYVCPYLRQIPMELVESLGTYALPGADPESLKVKVYKID